MTISMYSALLIWILFILLMQLVNGAQFLNTTFLLVLFTNKIFCTSFRLPSPASFELYLSASVSSLGIFFVDFFETLVILSAILIPIKSPVASAVF